MNHLTYIGDVVVTIRGLSPPIPDAERNGTSEAVGEMAWLTRWSEVGHLELAESGIFKRRQSANSKSGTK
jgi:hypothetical protein